MTSSYISPGRIPSIHAQARSNGIAEPGRQTTKVVESCTILKPAAELYAFSRRLENLTRILKYPLDALPLEGQDCLWWLSAEFDGQRVEWNAVIIKEEPDRLIAWQTLEGAQVPNAGTIRFQPAPADAGTEVTVQLEYDPPGGKLGEFFARLTAEEPKQQVRESLQRFKALMEAGSMPDALGPARG